MQCDLELSIVLPAYNEASRIEQCIKEVKRAVTALTSSYEIVVIEDGSTDGTTSIIASLSKTDSNLSFHHSPQRLGKGKAIKKGLSSAKGDVVVFMDVDLATSLESLPIIVKSAWESQGLVIGSRHVKGSKVCRSFTRTASSLTYNLLVRLIFHDGVHDHQCGFKAMNREVATFLRDNAKSDGFFLDTEMILLCKSRRIPVTEVAVSWIEIKKEDSHGIRIFRDSTKLGFDMLRFRLATSHP
jgi:glycosyltransferase involved in cell wall biosynthesis